LTGIVSRTRQAGLAGRTIDVTSPQAGRGQGTQQRGNTPSQQNRYLLRLR